MIKDFIASIAFYLTFAGCILLAVYTVVCFLCGEVIPLSMIWP